MSFIVGATRNDPRECPNCKAKKVHNFIQQGSAKLGLEEKNIWIYGCVECKILFYDFQV